uniref:Uncharacterized protein n=1 Tax=Leersia perrieri TaxID=77586 RepID=A0A0D9VRH5_9ORYZ
MLMFPSVSTYELLKYKSDGPTRPSTCGPTSVGTAKLQAKQAFARRRQRQLAVILHLPHELVCGTCCPCVVPGTPAAVTQNPVGVLLGCGSANRYVSTDLPGVRGVPTCDLRCATRLPLYALALSAVAPASSASPLYGHPVSAITMSTPG